MFYREQTVIFQRDNESIAKGLFSIPPKLIPQTELLYQIGDQIPLVSGKISYP